MDRTDGGTRRKRQVLFVVNVEWYFLSHRVPLAQALQARGFEVAVACGVERGRDETLRTLGFRVVPLTLSRRSLNPLRDLAALIQLYRIFRRERSMVVHNLTVKPVLYGSLAARAAGVPAIVNTVPGRGWLFLEGGGVLRMMLRRTVEGLYRFALASPSVRVILQNDEDRDYFTGRGLVSATRCRVIRGSGVDTRRFTVSPEPDGPPLVLFASRLLRDKGVGDFVEAARRLGGRGLDCRFAVVGEPDPGNPGSVSEADLRGWAEEGRVEVWGHREDMPEVLRQSAIVVLPSVYAEGVPKILIEAAASGRPIVTTDSPGCRDVVKNGVNGLLVPARDVEGLTEAIASLLASPARRIEMGRAGREMAVSEFSDERIVAETIAVYDELIGD